VQLLHLQQARLAARVRYAREFPPADGESAMATYTFNKHVLKHRFCPTCGCASFGEGVAASEEYMVAVNARCLDDVDVSALKIEQFDGRSL
jgi:hypothetical protein